jgi:DNA-binding winged helix-turn-helix (wHTH) protein
MALKNLTGVDSHVASYFTEMQLDNGPSGLNNPISGHVLLDEPGSPFADERPHRSLQSERFPNDEDYEVVLVPRRHYSLRLESVFQPPITPDRILHPQVFTWRELLDGLRRELSHSNPVEQNMIVCFGEVRVNLLTMEISRSEKPVVLTALEFRLLSFLIRTSKRVVTRNELLNDVWGYSNYPSTRTVDNHICRLRQKLESNPTHPIHFLTVHGIGYKFVP